MKILSGQFPPNIDKIKEKLDITDEMIKNKKIIFCYGDTVYNPTFSDIPDHQIAHEQVHVRQQQNKPDEWWELYLNDVDFRLSQEIEAYKAQYQYVKRFIKDRNLLNKYALTFAGYLSDEIYGNLITTLEALNLIKQD